MSVVKRNQKRKGLPIIFLLISLLMLSPSYALISGTATNFNGLAKFRIFNYVSVNATNFTGTNANLTGVLTLSGGSLNSNIAYNGNISGFNVTATNDLGVGRNAIVVGNVTANKINATSQLWVNGVQITTNGGAASSINTSWSNTTGQEVTNSTVVFGGVGIANPKTIYQNSVNTKNWTVQEGGGSSSTLSFTSPSGANLIQLIDSSGSPQLQNVLTIPSFNGAIAINTKTVSGMTVPSYRLQNSTSSTIYAFNYDDKSTFNITMISSNGTVGTCFMNNTKSFVCV